MRVLRWLSCCALSAALVGGEAVSAAPTKAAAARRVPPTVPVVRLEVSPAKVALSGPRSMQQVIVSAIYPDGHREDVTRRAVLSASPLVSVVQGRLRPLRDGGGTVEVRCAIRGARVVPVRLPIQVSGSTAAKSISFANEVIPVLTYAGCNSGACHGAQYGKGGFRLSLLGFDPAFDRKTMVEEKDGARVDLKAPERSLLLAKATMATPHGGGKRLATDSAEYRVLRDWLAQSAPGPAEGERRITGLQVEPPAPLLPAGAAQQLRVTAIFSDGAAEDVTARARFDTNNESVATVDAEGLATARQSGMAPLMVRYLGQAAVVRVLVPYARIRRYPAWPRYGLIDEHLQAGWKRLGLLPSGPASDAEFIRRVSLDLTGTLPAPEAVEAFVAECSAERAGKPQGALSARARLVDRLLASPEWVDFWTLYFGDILRNHRTLVGDKGMWSFRSWIQDSLRSGKPYNQMVRELVDVRGSIHRTGAANFYSVSRTPEELAKTTSQLFLGVRLECAECHNHPFEKWTQNDYYSLAAYFARVRYKGFAGSAFVGGDYLLVFSESGEVKHPRTGAVMQPRPLEGEAREIAGADRLSALAEWLADPKNPFVARNIVNRIWGRLMGRGIIDPVDDVRASNPATHPALLDALTRDFVEHGFDLKHLMRQITLSYGYGLSSQATAANEKDTQYYTHYRVRRLGAEQLLDAVSSVTDVPERFTDLPAGMRAIALPDPSVSSPFLDTFGRPARETVCECERTDEPNLSQTLVLMNGEALQRKIAAKEGRLAKLLAAGRTDEEIIRELYLRALSRPPTADEAHTARGFIQEAGDRPQGLQDLLWTLLNTREFLVQH